MFSLHGVGLVSCILIYV